MNWKPKNPISKTWILASSAAGWLLLISSLHFWFNFDHGSKKIISMGYMPVITNLAAPLLDYVSSENTKIHFKALKFSSFAEMAEALRHDEIQAAFMIAPLAVVLHQQGEDVNIVYIGNRHESTFVVRKDLNAHSLHDLVGKTVAVPMRYSGHNLSLLKQIEENGLTGRIKVVELNPPDMASAIISGALDAYFVGEPFAAQTLINGTTSLLYYVEDVWDSFICNLVIVKQTLIEDEPETVKMLVEGAVRSGLWAQKNPHKAAEIAASYWNQPVDLVEHALTKPADRIVFDQYIPKEKEMQEIADLMVHFKLIENNNISGLIDDRFTQSIQQSNVEDLRDIFKTDGLPAQQGKGESE
jgi:NitT/TauT family transport system substrate-binding protein